MRKQVALFLILVLVATLGIGCSTTAQEDKSSNVLGYWGITPPPPVTISATNISDWTYDIGEAYDISVKDMKLVDGVYKVQSRFYDSHSWGSFMVLKVVNGKATQAKMDYFNQDGVQTNVKSLDVAYADRMFAAGGARPAQAYAALEKNIVYTQVAEYVDTVTGATSSSTGFKELAGVALQAAVKGDTNVQYVDFEPHYVTTDRAPNKVDGYSRTVTIVFQEGTDKIEKVSFTYLSKGLSIMGNTSNEGQALAKADAYLQANLPGKSAAAALKLLETATLSGNAGVDNDVKSYFTPLLALRKPVSQSIDIYAGEVLGNE